MGIQVVMVVHPPPKVCGECFSRRFLFHRRMLPNMARHM
ncbi:hypothetical protein BURPS305_7273 [Burkholderia pseudomallei 305]|nr:hypothetical protein BURPS305_7273 [Burkholderia pseudomallei 305]